MCIKKYYYLPVPGMHFPNDFAFARHAAADGGGANPAKNAAHPSACARSAPACRNSAHILSKAFHAAAGHGGCPPQN